VPESSDPSIVVDVWHVADGSQEEFMDALVALVERVRALEGFVDGQILKGVDPTLFVSYVTMRSAQDREAAFLDGEVQEMLRAIGGLARQSPHAYTVARRFAPPGA
jgi:hypothetical protein